MSDNEDPEHRADSEFIEEDNELAEFVQELRSEGKLPPENSPIGKNHGGGTYQTGPKGVIRDYKIAQQKSIEAEENKRRQVIDKINQASFTVAKDEDEFKDEIDEEEERLLAQMRQEQLKHLQKISSGERDTIKREKTFGDLYQVYQKNFIQFIDSEGPDTVVIIHLYQSYVPSCKKLNAILEELAKIYPKSKFGKIVATEAKPGFADDGLPSLVIYKGGELVASYVRLQDDLAQSFDIDDVEEFLIENAILFKKNAVKEDDKKYT